MSSFAKTRCPKCGAIKSHHLGGLGFYQNEVTTCSCGFSYQNVPNCIENVADRDEPPRRNSDSLLAHFTTEQLEQELIRRKS